MGCGGGMVAVRILVRVFCGIGEGEKREMINCWIWIFWGNFDLIFSLQ